MRIYKNNLNKARPFITKDSSIIRSILDATNAKMGNISLAEATVMPGRSTIAHIHPETEEIYYFTQGGGFMELNGKKVPVKKGDGVLIKPGTEHKMTNTGRIPVKILCACAPPYSHTDTITTENRYKLVIFDFDGTLVDSATGIWTTANAMAREFGMKPFRKDDIVDTVGTGLDNFIEDLFPCQLEKIGMKKLIGIYRRYYDRLYKTGLRVFPGVRETLKELKGRGIVLAVASNKLKRYVDGINSRIGIAKYFSSTYGSEDVVRRKPHPEVVYTLMKRYRASRQETLFVGDSQYDVLTAKNARVDCAFLTYGYADKKMIKKLKPEFILGHFSDLKKLV
ncbi:MAG: HAD-IA family hydrolase [Spirochaetia bacterium]|nr:HAD-IA family hydrolase [Spirochaetia bacterium]